MRHRIIVILLVVFVCASLAAAQSTAPINVGDTVEVKSDESAPQLQLSVTEPQVVTLIARGNNEDTDPYLSFLAADGREIAYSSDHNSKRADVNRWDAVIENLYLLPGEYQLSISGLYGDQFANVTVEEGDPGMFGLGETAEVPGTIVPRGRFRHTLPLNEKEIVTVSVLSLTEDFDARLEVRDPQGVVVAANDDRGYDTGDPVLDYRDPQVKYLVVPKAGDYDIEITSYSESETGEIMVYVTTYGALNSDDAAEPETFSGELVEDGRLDFRVALKAGEIVNVTARSVDDSVDTRLTIRSQQGVAVAENDDHRTGNPDLNYTDSVVGNLVVPVDGEYTIEVTPLSGSGEIEVTVDHLGTFESAEAK